MTWSSFRPRYEAYARIKPRVKIPPGRYSKSSFSKAWSMRTLTFVEEAISSRETPRNSRSLRKFSPKEATTFTHSC